jgi:cell surface protein SprA
MDTIRSQISTFGRTMDYSHNYSVSYNIPLDKFPLTNWITSNVKYTGTFNWQRAPLGQAPFGNTIQNNRTLNMTLQGNFVTLYNKIPYFKRVLSDGKGMKGNVNSKVGNDGGDGGAAGKPKAGTVKLPEFKPEKPVEEMTAKELKQYERQKKRFDRQQLRIQAIKDKEKEKVNPIGGFFARLIMSVRNVSGTYALTDGTMLPGYNQESSVLGMNGTSLGMSGFVFGKQGYDLLGRTNGYNVSTLARDNNWLVQNENLNKQFTTTHTANLQLKATLEPIKDLNVNLNLSRNYSTNSGP